MIQQELQSIFTKINAITADSSVLNPLERDLVKNYLLQAYRIVEDGSMATASSKEKMVSTSTGEIKPPKLQSPVLLQEKAPEPIPVESLNEIASEPTTAISNGSHAVEDQRDPLADLLQVPQLDEKYAEVFTWEESQDLSDHLSKSPITDLHRAFGINDRLRFQNELFGGDTMAFNDALDTLNRKPDFISAKSFIARHLIDRYDWLAESRVVTAREFTKLLSRRFS